MSIAAATQVIGKGGELPADQRLAHHERAKLGVKHGGGDVLWGGNTGSKMHAVLLVGVRHVLAVCSVA